MFHFPSTKSLRAFEATARLGSVKAAADHLHVSGSALSRRIQTLEEELGEALFRRDTQGLTLTDAGRYYAEQLRGIFSTLEQATRNVRRAERRRITVVGPALVLKPCMEQLHNIEEALPGIDLEFHTKFLRSAAHPALTDANVAFFWGAHEWEGWTTQPITQSTHFVPLCAPSLLKDGMPMSTEMLSEHTWIVPLNFDDSWRVWSQAVGVTLPPPKRTMTVADSIVASQVAQRGGGIWMAQGFNHISHLSVLAQQLVPAHAFHALVPDQGLHLGTRNNDGNPDSRKFIAWFFNEIWNLPTLQRTWQEARK